LKTVQEFKLGISASSKITLSFKDAMGTKDLVETDKIGTGTIVNVLKDGVLSNSYSMVVYGDVNGDGDITLNDLSSMKEHINGKTLIADPYAPAGDLYNEGSITLNDLVGVMAYISEAGIINQNL
jgi:hypothetical protein